MIGVKTAAAAAAVGLATMVGAPLAAAEQTSTNWLGTQADIVDGPVVQGWTVSHLQPSTDTIPYAVQGQLWEATASDTSIQGDAVPIVSNFNARAADGQTYRVLWEVATPQGVNPSTLAQGGTTRGKLYFDVTGSAPDSVIYRGIDGPDLALWLTPPPSSGTASSGASSSVTSVPVTPSQAASEAPTAAGDEASPEAQSLGTPIAPGVPAAPAAGAAESGQVLPPAQSLGTPIGEVGAQTPAAPAESPVTVTAPAGEAAPAAQPASEAAPAAQPASEGTPAPSADAGASNSNVVPLTPVTPAPAAG
ncbi:MAG: MPT63 family protein [Actinomycetia bacterium]|nr:MPT63 family protein [Actinomycetes bacterium]